MKIIKYEMNYINLLYENNQSHVNHKDKYYSYQQTLNKAQLVCVYISLSLPRQI